MKRTLLKILCTLLVVVMSLGFMSDGIIKTKANAAYENTPSSYSYPLRKIAENGRGYTSGHKGIDFTIAKGTAVYASKSGTVEIVYSGCKNYNGANSNGQDCKEKGCTQSKVYMNGSGYKAGYYCNNGFGNGVVVKNDDGKFCYYAHFNTVNVKKGDKVTPNTKLGEVGSSGCSTGAHLHFSINSKASGGTSYNPFNYIFPGFKIALTNNVSSSVNPKLSIYFPWKQFTATKCQICFGTSASSLSKNSSDSNVTVRECFYDLGNKFGDLTKGKTYYVKVTITKDGVTYNSSTYSFVAGSGNRTFLDYSTVTNPVITVTFNGNGGTPSSTSGSFTVDKIYGDTMPSATRNGYTFDGWYTSATGGSRVTRGSTVTAGNKTLYAHWIKNQTDALKVGHIYRIYNENSGLILAANGSGNNAQISQRNLGEKGNGELWRVNCIDENGCYEIENLNGARVIDIDAKKKWDFGTPVQIYDQNNGDSQKFSIVKRANKEGYSGVYSIHSKNSGRAIDVEDKSTKSGALLVQWDYHSGTNQLFYFKEVTTRKVEFFDNLNNNYITSPKEEYVHVNSVTPKDNYTSRATDYVNVSFKPNENSIVINSLKAGSSGKDMKFYTLINGSYNSDFYELNDATMVLKFRAKSSVSGAKIYFRWGYETTFKSVELTTEWKDYSVELPRTKVSGNNIHPYIDKVCTVEMADIALYEKGTEESLGNTDAYTSQSITADIYDPYSCKAPSPSQKKEGYIFDGWYTRRVGGTKVADAGDYYDVSNLAGTQRLYAHWSVCEHSYDTEVILEATHNSEGIKKLTCVFCGNSYTDSIDRIACSDNNGDGVCDGCNKDLGTKKPINPTTPDDNCSCDCHKGGIAGFFFKLILLFQKIFGINKTCGCGINHY